MSRKHRNISRVILSPADTPLSEFETRLILETANAMVYEAGRSTLVLALRGSKSKKLEKFQTQDLLGFGYYQKLPEIEVLARVDQLIHQGLLRIDTSRDGFPLLGFTPRGLELAEKWTAERWLTELREHFDDHTPYLPTFARDRMPNRNLKTVNLVIDSLETQADPSWLALLEHWQQNETARIAKRLRPITEQLRKPI